jgi:hypothetical protein
MQKLNLYQVIIVLYGILDNAAGQISWQNGKDGPWAFGCDFFGNDLSRVASRGEECSGKCKQTSGCTHYTWTNFNGGTCWMKKNLIRQSNAIRADQSFVCGILNSVPSVVPSVFSNGKFRHGIGYNGDSNDFDYITIWIGTIDNKGSTDFNIWHQGEMIKQCISKNKIPLFYSYIIAFEARAKAGLQDCDVAGSNNLCTDVNI